MPRGKDGYDGDAILAWLIDKGLADYPTAPTSAFERAGQQVERTAADCGMALGVNVCTVREWLKDPTFPGVPGDSGQRNGMFPTEKIKAWSDARRGR